MKILLFGICASLASVFAGQNAKTQPPASMTKMVVRLMGQDIRPGSFAALPRTIYRAGQHFARIEDPPGCQAKGPKAHHHRRT